MDLMQQMSTDVQQILTTDFATPILFTPPSPALSKTCMAVQVKTNLRFSMDGTPVNSKTTRLTVSEGALVAAGLTVRNANKEVLMVGWKVSYTDVQNNTWTATIRQNIAGETNGIITLMLDDHK